MIKGNTGREKSGIARRLMCVWLSLLLTGSVSAFAADSAASGGTRGDVNFPIS